MDAAFLLVLAFVLASANAEQSPAPVVPIDELDGEALARSGGRAAILDHLPSVRVLWVPLQLGPYRLRVASDALQLGGLRWSPTHLQAQAVADAFGALLPTPTIVDAIWKSAAVRLQPKPRNARGARMMSVDEWLDYARSIEPTSPGTLVAPLGKDYVQVPGLRPEGCAIYGWHRENGKPIQPVNTRSHESTYADYSHTARLVSRDVERNDGSTVDLAELYSSGDPWIAPLGSTPPRHPGI